MACRYAGLAGLELVLEVGIENIQERLRDLTDRILERCDEAGVKTFTPRERERRCGIVTLECERPEAVEASLHAPGGIVDSPPRRIRPSPHSCATEQELEPGMDLAPTTGSAPGGTRDGRRRLDAELILDGLHGLDHVEDAPVLERLHELFRGDLRRRHSYAPSSLFLYAFSAPRSC